MSAWDDPRTIIYALAAIFAAGIVAALTLGAIITGIVFLVRRLRRRSRI